jgi:hypothetical protein
MTNLRPLLLVVAVLGLARVADATVANDICAANANPCIVASNVAVTAGSTLDFQQRALQLSANGRLTSSGNMTILAGSVSLAAGARLTAVGTLIVTVADDITTLGAGSTLARLDASGTANPHGIQLTAGDDITLNGLTDASGTTTNPAGLIDIMAGGDIAIGGDVLVPGAGQGGSGALRATAQGAFTLSGQIDGTGGGLDGADVELRAVTGAMNLPGEIDVSGGGSFGGGGFVSLAADVGNLTLGGILKGTGGSGGEDCGDGAIVTVDSGGTTTIGPTAVVTLNAGSNCFGGDFDVRAGVDFIQNGPISDTGGGVDGEGGAISVLAFRNLLFGAPIDLSGGSGGILDATAGALLTASNDMLADGNSVFGTGGTLLLESCTMNITGTARLLARGDIGFIALQASGQMTIDGVLTSTENILRYRNANQVPDTNGATISPSAQVTQDPNLPECGSIVVPPTTTTSSTSTTTTTSLATTSSTTTTVPTTTSTTTTTLTLPSTTSTTTTVPTTTSTSSTTTTTGTVPSTTTTASTTTLPTTTSTTTSTSSTTSSTGGSTTSTTASTTTSTSAATTTSTTAVSTSSTTSTTGTTGTTTSTVSTTTSTTGSTTTSTSGSTTSSTTGTTTTTVPSTTSTLPTTTTTTPTTSTTTTTIPQVENCSDGIDNDRDGLTDCADPQCFGDPICLGECPVSATFDSLDCRLDAVILDVVSEPGLGKAQASVTDKLDQARNRKQQAEGYCAQGNTRRARSALRRAIRRLVSAQRDLRPRNPAVPANVSGPFLAAIEEIRLDMRSLSFALHCPTDVL